MNTKRIQVGLLAAGAALTIAACGGSSKASGIMLASGGVTADTTSTTATTTAATTTTASVTTPTSGALSKQPVFTVPGGAVPTKLEVKDIIVGTGPAVKSGDTVWANYVGKLYSNGKVFNSTWRDNGGEPAEFTVTSGSGGVIEGWAKGLVGMKVGGRRELIIPSSLGYGKAGYGSTIPKNAALVFVVDLIKVGQ